MNIAILLSGGIGSRMKTGGIPKQYIEVKNKPILMHTINKFQNCDLIDNIIIVADKCWQEKIYSWIIKDDIDKFIGFALPGKSRQESILHGLESCINLIGTEDIVIIHDAVRPFVSVKLIEECILGASEYDGCMPVLPVTDTVYYSSDGSKIDQLLDRDKLFLGQSPEAFNFLKYYNANKLASSEEIDSTRGSSEIAFKNNLKIKLITGEGENFKLTTPSDLERFKILVGDSNESL